LPGGVDTLQTATTTCTGIPAAARAIVGNATTVSPQSGGFLTLFPADASRPLVASSNYEINQIVNGPFTVGLSPAGQVKVFTTGSYLDSVKWRADSFREEVAGTAIMGTFALAILDGEVETDERAAYVKSRPFTPGELVATIFHVLGIDPSLQFTHPSGRPKYMIDEGRVPDELV